VDGEEGMNGGLGIARWSLVVAGERHPMSDALRGLYHGHHSARQQAGLRFART